MATSVVPAVVSYLVTTFKAAATLGTASPPVAIRTGPELGSFAPRVLWVAIDDPYGTQPGTPSGAESSQTFVGMPAGNRDETAAIYLCAESWAGTTDTLPAMLDAYAITSAAEDILRSNIGLGDTTGRRWQFPGFTGATLRWHQGEGGCAAQVLCRVEFQARIGTSPV